MRLVIDSTAYIRFPISRRNCGLIELEKFILVIQLMGDIYIVVSFEVIDSKKVIHKNSFSFQERLGIFKINF